MHGETNDETGWRVSFAYGEIEINAVIGKHGGRPGKINEKG